jgi:hypothetical protein
VGRAGYRSPAWHNQPGRSGRPRSQCGRFIVAPHGSAAALPPPADENGVPVPRPQSPPSAALRPLEQQWMRSGTVRPQSEVIFTLAHRRGHTPTGVPGIRAAGWIIQAEAPEFIPGSASCPAKRGLQSATTAAVPCRKSSCTTWARSDHFRPHPLRPGKPQDRAVDARVCPLLWTAVLHSAPSVPPPHMKTPGRGTSTRIYPASTPDCAQQQTIHPAYIPSGFIRRPFSR